MSKRISPPFLICLMTAVVSNLSVTGSKGEDHNMACVNEPLWHTAFIGDSVRINCTYLLTGESPVKHFYRDNPDSGGTDLISTHNSPKTKKDRFSLTDHKEQGVYTVMISTAGEEDTGRYRCAKRTVNDNFTCLTQIHLHIVNRNKTPKGTHTDDAARIECPYPNSHENNTKYLCKGKTPLKCVELIQTTEDEIYRAKGRFSIRDSKRSKYFYVNIQNLSTADSGTYWCGSDRKWHNAAYTKINLFIDEKHIKTKKSGPQQTTAAPSSTTTLHDPSFSGRIIGATVACLALLVTVGIVLIVFIHKLCRTQGGSIMQSTNAGQNFEDNHNDRVYEEIKERNQGPSSGDTTMAVYALADLPAEQLHYASVSFQQEAVTVYTDRNPHPDTDGTDPPALYSTVKDLEEL